MALLLVSVTPSASAYNRSCPNVKGAEVIGTTNVSCRSARKLARVWVQNVQRDGRYDRDLFGYKCRNRPSRAEGDTMVCRKGRRLVTWYVNAFWAV